MVFDLLGPSLEDLFNYCNRRFSFKTILMLADQLLDRLQLIHSREIVHRDIKPENFLIGTGRQGTRVYITDFGLAWSEHAATAVKGRGLIGTALFASVNGHLGYEQDACDDLESIGYMLLYSIGGSLPRQSLCSTRNGQEKDEILEVKANITVADLCKDAPQVFTDYFMYLRGHPELQSADHRMLRRMFQKAFRKMKHEYDNVFDWTILKFMEASAKHSEIESILPPPLETNVSKTQSKRKTPFAQ